LDEGSARRKASTYTHDVTNTDKRIQITMLRVAFEPTTLPLERPKTVHALDLAVTVIS
jgi:hypothetical protein